MSRPPLVLTLIGLAACSANSSPAEQKLLAHTWAPTVEACSSDFLRFTPTAFEVHHADAPTTALQVLKIASIDRFPDNVLVVVGPNAPGSTKPVAEDDKTGWVFDLSDNRMKLVGAGSPTHLGRVSPDDANLQRFDRVACS